METARKGWAVLGIFRVWGIYFQCLLKAICVRFLKKAIVYDFSKKLLSLHSLEMNKLMINGENQNFRPDVTFPCSVQKKTRHSCSLNWEWSRMTQVFCRNKLPSWKQSYRWAEKSLVHIYLTTCHFIDFSSFGFKLGVFPTYNSEQIGISSVAVT